MVKGSDITHSKYAEMIDKRTRGRIFPTRSVPNHTEISVG